MKWSKLLLALALGGAAFAGLRGCLPSDQKRILRLLTSLAEDVSAPAQGRTLADLAAANRVADHFAPGFQIQVTVPGAPDVAVSDRAELIRTIAAAKGRTRQVQVRFLDPQTVELGPASAVIEATAQAQVSGDPELYVVEIRFTLAKLEGRWRVRQVENVPTFE